MLNVLICERWSAGPTTLPLGSRPPLSTTTPFHGVANCESYEFGVWNHERVNPEVEVKRIDFRELIVDAVEEIFFVAPVVHDDKLGRIKEPAAVQAAHRDKVSPLRSSVSEIGRHVGCSK